MCKWYTKYNNHICLIALVIYVRTIVLVILIINSIWLFSKAGSINRLDKYIIEPYTNLVCLWFKHHDITKLCIEFFLNFYNNAICNEIFKYNHFNYVSIIKKYQR